MKKILIIIPFFYPGFRSGGPQQTIMNFCEVFCKKMDIYILTQNYDCNTNVPYEGIKTNTWLKLKNVNVKYLSKQDFGYKAFRSEYEKFDLIYVCNLFEKSTYLTLIIHRFAKTNKKVYVAPMGVFSEGALSLKKTKKTFFLFVCKRLGIFNKIKWSFTSELEYGDAKRVLGEKLIRDNYIIAEDLPKAIDFENNILHLNEHEKEDGQLRIIFLSRISPMKNLLECAKILNAKFNGNIQFDIYGVMEDAQYWNMCEIQLNLLPNKVVYKYCGEVMPSQVTSIFEKYDIFLFPTKGENFGHVIYEALASGCIPVISDKTPWQGLEIYGCGNVIPLNDIERFRDKINQWLVMNQDEFCEARRAAINYARMVYDNSIRNSGYNRILEE